MANYKTYAQETWLYFTFSILAYFLPFIIVEACLLPIVKEASGLKIAIGLGIVLINAVPFLMGVFRAFFAHFPMFNMLAVVFLFLAVFFALDVFKSCVDKLLWIEFAAAAGSIVSCISWSKYRKYSKWRESVKANVRCGAFVLKEDTENDRER